MTFSIRQRIAIVFAFALSIILVLGILSYRNLAELHAIVEGGRRAQAAPALLRGIGSRLERMAGEARSYLAGGEKSRRQSVLGALAELEHEMDTLGDVLPDDASTQARAYALNAAVNRWLALVRNAVAERESQKGPGAAAAAFRQEAPKLLDQISGQLTALAASAPPSWERMSRHASAALQRGAVTIAVLLAVAVLAVFIGGPYVARSIVAPLAALGDAANRFAQGDLKYRVRGAGRDEVGRVAAALNGMAAKLEGCQQTCVEESRILHSILISMGEGVLVGDAQGRCLLFNPAAEQLLGLSRTVPLPERQAARYCLSLPDGVALSPVPEADLVQAMSGRAAGELEIQALNPDLGEVRWLSATATPLRDEQGEVTGGVVLLRDITEQKHADAVLRESQEKYRALVETTPDWIWSMDAGGQLTYNSPAVTAILGYEPGELNGMYSPGLMHEEDRWRFSHLFPRYMQEGQGWEGLVLRWRHKDGSYRVLESKGVPIWGRDGTLQGVRGVSRDVTAETEASEAVKESERLLTLILEVLPVGVWLADGQGGILRTNPTALRLLGGARPDGSGQHTPAKGWFADTGKRIAPTEWALLRAATKGDTSIGEVIDIECADGSRRTVLSSAVPVLGPKGEVAGGVLVMEDITALRQAEAARRRLAAVLEATSDLVASYEPDGRVLYLNAAARALLGIGPQDDVSQMKIADIHPDWAAARLVETAIPAAIRDGVWSGESALQTRTGQEIHVSLVIVAHSSHRGELRYFSVIARDITQRKQAEEEIRKLNQELRERVSQLDAANRELEAFAYSVSHDLRAPLRAIDGFSEALLEDHGDQLDAQGADYLRRVRAASQRMGQLIDDLLMLSRVSRAEMYRSEVDLTALAQSIGDDLRGEDPARQVDFAVQPGMLANADPRLLRIVLENIFGNAWKFTRKQNRARIEAGSTVRGGKLFYFVRDNGVGFDMAYAGKLFTPFQRLHGAAEFEGTGIGLATVQRIIVRHGGEVAAESTLGQGATFFFTLG
ncbi:MAG: PAS domain S-box protein [Bryobacterales bacterium]|nr:PAS domain S-box protein [Bryobacterales bacterium]